MEIVSILLLTGIFLGGAFVLTEYTRKKRNRLWSAVADALHLEFVPATGLTGRPAIYGSQRGVQVNIDIRVYGNGKNQQTYTRVEAELPRETPEDLLISKEGFFSGVGKLFGVQDIQVGIPKVDEAFIIKGRATKVPTELPILVNTTTSRILVILFFQKPLRDEMSSGSLSKSFTFGFPRKASTRPETQPAAIMGLREVTGEATTAERIVSG